MVQTMATCDRSSPWSLLSTTLPARQSRFRPLSAFYLAGGSSGHAYRVFGINVPFSIAVLDTTSAQQLPGAAAIRMAAGHAIALNPPRPAACPTTAPRIRFRWNQGTLSYVVGKGIAVGWQNVCSGNTTLANYLAGNIVFLVGNASPYTITLPAASTVPAGTGFTLSVPGTAAVTIATSGSDTIDNGPVTLRTNDRYHVVFQLELGLARGVPDERRQSTLFRTTCPAFLHCGAAASVAWQGGEGFPPAMVGSPAKAPAQAPVSRPSMTGSIGYRSAAVQRSLHGPIVLPP